jgi:hypothetical protein
MRACKTCGLEQETKLFPKSSQVGSKVYYRHDCTACYTRTKGLRRKDLRLWFNSLKEGLACARCEVSDFRVLVFHHLNPKEKDFNLGDIVKHSWSRSKVLAEIEKCQVLCANCHLVVHWELDNGV